MLLSILIPTLESRRALFGRISATLQMQIHACGWDDRIEILSMADAGELPTGTKRNALMRRARGEFIASVDDDDDVSEQYVELVGGALLAHPDVDCLGIRGEVTYVDFLEMMGPLRLLVDAWDIVARKSRYPPRYPH